jgi:hypothetical protein
MAFKGKGLKPVAIKLWVNLIQRAPPHRGENQFFGFAIFLLKEQHQVALLSARIGRCPTIDLYSRSSKSGKSSGSFKAPNSAHRRYSELKVRSE